MFDHLVTQQQGRKRIVRLHHHVSVFAIVVGVVSSVIAVNLTLPTFHTANVSQARESSLTVRLVTGVESRSIVGPLYLEPIMTVEAQVRDEALRLSAFQFYLDGVYDPAGIDGIALFLDGIQVGVPQKPASSGVLRFPLATALLEPGTHRMQAKMTSNLALGTATFQAAVDPDASFVTEAGGVHVLVPYRTELLHVVEHGTLEVFTQRSTQAVLGSAYLYSEAEDFRLNRIRLQADRDLSGTQIDVFHGSTFLATAIFDGATAEIDLTDTVTRSIRGQNLIVSFLMTPLDKAVASLKITEIAAFGITSQSEVTIPSQVELLSD